MKAAALCVCAALLASAATAQELATVRSVKGDVSVQKAGQKAFAPAAPGMTLALGDAIATDIDSQAVLGLPAKAEVTVYELSQIKINKMFVSPDASKLQLLLRSGRVETAIPEKSLIRTDFSVKTPVATASIRGSREIVAHAVSQGTTVQFLEGHGSTQSNSGRATDVTAGDENAIETDGSLTDAGGIDRRSASPDLLPAGRDNSEKSVSAPAGRFTDRVPGEAAYPSSVSGDQAQSSSPIKLRIRLQTIP